VTNPTETNSTTPGARPSLQASVVIISLTDEGKAVAEKILHSGLRLPDQTVHHHKPKPFTDVVTHAFQAGSRLIFICSTGIVIRTLAPVLAGKTKDPAVLVIDQDCQHVISLLSGHEGGANQWARDVALALNATPVITSAENYLRPVYTLGLGCDRGCPKDIIEQLVDECLSQVALKYPDFLRDDLRDNIAHIASIDLKADEVGLLQYCEEQQNSLQVFPASQLRTVEDQLSYKSEIVFKEVGCYGVAEAAALLAASASTGKPAELVLEKQKSKRATCAVARSYQ